MQSQSSEGLNYPLNVLDFVKMSRFLSRYRTHPEALDPYINSLRKKGIPESKLTVLQDFFIVWRKAYLDQDASYRLDSYLMTGMGAVDLVLLTIVIPMGVPDRPLFIAVLALAASLVLVSSSLLMSFVKRDLHITGYGSIHSALIFLSLASGTTALVATFWHVSMLIGLVFLALVVLAYFACTMYAIMARLIDGYRQVLQVANTPLPPDSGEPGIEGSSFPE